MTDESRGIVGSDARVRKRRGSAAQRGDLAMAQSVDRIDSASGTITTDAERRALIRSEWTQTVLPKAPEIPGFHTCWLSTTSTIDTIHRRMKVGYTLVRKDELKGFEAENVQSGTNQYSDYVTCNEMVLAKIPTEMYQSAMAEFHHFGPRDEERAIRTRVQQKAEELNQEAGVQAVRTVGGGFDTLGVAQQQTPPVFKE